MEDDEEYFIIRCRGPAKNRELVYNCLTGQSADFDNYLSNLTTMEIGRATCLGDIFEFMTPKTTDVPQIEGSSSETEKKPEIGSMDPVDTLNDVKEEEEQAETDDHEEKFGTIGDDNVEEEVKFSSIMEDPSGTRLKQNEQHLEDDFGLYSTPSTSSETPYSFRHNRSIPSRYSTPYNRNINSFSQRHSLKKKEGHLVFPKEPVKYVSSTQLKRHNISFERAPHS